MKYWFRDANGTKYTGELYIWPDRSLLFIFDEWASNVMLGGYERLETKELRGETTSIWINNKGITVDCVIRTKKASYTDKLTFHYQ